MNESTENLLPCPFCGENPIIRQIDKSVRLVRCNSCNYNIFDSIWIKMTSLNNEKLPNKNDHSPLVYNRLIKTKIKFKYEKVKDSTYRAAVFGGWILVSVGGIVGDPKESMVFIPDPNHEWEIE